MLVRKVTTRPFYEMDSQTEMRWFKRRLWKWANMETDNLVSSKLFETFVERRRINVKEIKLNNKLQNCK